MTVAWDDPVVLWDDASGTWDGQGGGGGTPEVPIYMRAQIRADTRAALTTNSMATIRQSTRATWQEQ